MEAERKAKVVRDTKETSIVAELNIDGTGVFDISTGIGFFDHMLAGFAKHGFFDLSLKAKGDLNVDSHHTVEDVGIVIGQAIREALGNKAGITRYGFFLLPMDETLVECAIDLSGRPYFVYDVNLLRDFLLGRYEPAHPRDFRRQQSPHPGGDVQGICQGVGHGDGHRSPLSIRSAFHQGMHLI